ncbi:hypothetical protein H9L39_11924 [Fusarium oxysporum f. sp. albedinis]|nr:hypothetical protein H9L39_11924 [Fusarium oxysporum f. sp. albedinis]
MYQPVSPWRAGTHSPIRHSLLLPIIPLSLTSQPLEDAGPLLHTSAGFNQDFCGLPGSRLRPFFDYLYLLRCRLYCTVRRLADNVLNFLPCFKS